LSKTHLEGQRWFETGLRQAQSLVTMSGFGATKCHPDLNWLQRNVMGLGRDALNLITAVHDPTC
jgi:hypothetical protein